MTIRSRATLKGYFNTNDTPSETNFADMLDSLALLKDDYWLNYFPSSNVIGWSGYGTSQIYVYKSERLILVEFALIGTSDDPTTSFTLPDTHSTPSALWTPFRAQDNGGSYGWGAIYLPSASNIVTLYLDPGLATWTASGQKTCQGTFIYHTQTP